MTPFDSDTVAATRGEDDRTATNSNTSSSTTDGDDVLVSIQRRLQSSPMPTLTITSPETLESCRNLRLRTSDIFICSYPKSGTTWTQHIVLSLLVHHHHRNNQTETNDNDDDDEGVLEYSHVSQFAPFFEVDQHWETSPTTTTAATTVKKQNEQQQQQLIPRIQSQHAKLGRRVFNTHLRWDMLPTTLEGEEQGGGGGEHKGVYDQRSFSSSSGGAKFIYLVRSPLDVCVSFYHHLSNQQEGGYEGGFNSFFQDWIDGKIAFGSYFDHLMSFIPAFSSPSPPPPSSTEASQNSYPPPRHGPCQVEDTNREVLLISYEELLEDLGGTVRRIARFIDVNLSDNDILQLLPSFEFQNMKSELHKFQPRSVTWKNNFQFLRNGTVGDSNNIITDTQRHKWIDAVEKSKIKRYLETTITDPTTKTRFQSLFESPLR